MRPPFSLGFSILFALTVTAGVHSDVFAQQPGEPSAALPYAAPSNAVPSGQTGSELILEAKLSKDGDTVERGMVWRVFAPTAGDDGKLPMLATGAGGTSSFHLAPGTYLVHAAFGRAGATKRVQLKRGGLRETFVLQAGGLKLDAETNQTDIPNSKLRFSIYHQKPDAEGNRKLIALKVPANRVVRLNEGTYHVVSRYGNVNAVVRADLKVQAGKVTEALMQHRAAEVNLKLVSEKGGEAIANTAWSVLTEQGDVVMESNSAYPSVVLGEGSYSAIARHKGSILSHDFKIEAGRPVTIEVAVVPKS